jgi:hypothetical protein
MDLIQYQIADEPLYQQTVNERVVFQAAAIEKH